MSHQSLKKNSGIYIDHKRNKICKNERFLELPLFHAAWFLQKMALKLEWNLKFLPRALYI